MASTRLLMVFLGATLPLLFLSPAEAGEVGVTYGRVANNLPNPARVVKLLQDNGITMVRLYDADPVVLKAFAYTGIKVMVMLPNDDLAAAAKNQSFALQWARRNVASYYPATRINGVAVGNEVFQERSDLTRQLVPAMINVHHALVNLNLDNAIKVSTPIAFSALKDTYPPSSGRFRDDIAQSVMKPMLKFLVQTGSYLSMNPYPFFAYAEDPNIDLDYALGNYKPGVNDTNTGLIYHCLLDAMMDATYFAIEKLAEQLSIRQGSTNTQFTEVGWPSGGQIRHRGIRPLSGNIGLDVSDGFQPATVANAKEFNNYVIKRMLSGKTGTPHLRNADTNIYIFALFNENQKGQQGPYDDVEKNWGLYYPNMTKVYEFNFRGSSMTESWCVANAAVGDERLQAALDFACGHGADCSAIQPGGKCFQPNTMIWYASTSYAFNSYYQRNQRALGTCDFAGAAHGVHRKPKFGNCVLPSKDWIDETAAKSEGYAAI
ncbi:hypothetical protein PR202_ga29700 [Eleusine coracana subsp. coracana]|uniref:X8 domain-containing protein n=1 Tax=Eleusine coracana subsp. coracana TaxID=191504 RepID=A0AAV5DN13_ELECO|nr:hypothetical protein PR202_ga29700 [Eleusine coracana subsp. coracana]